MVEDNQIKAQVSPFAIRKGEIKTFDGQDGYVSMNQVVHKINIGHITDIHFAILYLVNEFEFITSRQLMQMLQIKGYEVKSQDKLNNKLEGLIKSKILTRYYFTSDEGKGIYRIYCLAFSGDRSISGIGNGRILSFLKNKRGLSSSIDTDTESIFINLFSLSVSI